MFYTHDESLKFTNDFNRETIKAESQGMTWYEWWETRTDEDVAKDEEENLYAWSDEDDSIELNDDISSDEDFRF